MSLSAEVVWLDGLRPTSDNLGPLRLYGSGSDKLDRKSAFAVIAIQINHIKIIIKLDYNNREVIKHTMIFHNRKLIMLDKRNYWFSTHTYF